MTRNRIARNTIPYTCIIVDIVHIDRQGVKASRCRIKDTIPEMRTSSACGMWHPKPSPKHNQNSIITPEPASPRLPEQPPAPPQSDAQTFPKTSHQPHDQAHQSPKDQAPHYPHTRPAPYQPGNQ